MNLRALQELLQDEDFVDVEEIKEWLEEYLDELYSLLQKVDVLEGFCVDMAMVDVYEVVHELRESLNNLYAFVNQALLKLKTARNPQAIKQTLLRVIRQIESIDLEELEEELEELVEELCERVEHRQHEHIGLHEHISLVLGH